MSLGATTVARAQRVVTWLTASQWIPVLLVRLFIGYFFFETGWAKIGNLDGMAERFTGWGIPFPAFNAVLSAYTELIGGGLVMLGLVTRLAAVPMAVNMVVAILVVNIKRVSGLDEFVELSEPLYALVFLWLLFAGPGRASLDHLLWRRFAPDDTRVR
jgi:putative oxidoreductase